MTDSTRQGRRMDLPTFVGGSTGAAICVLFATTDVDSVGTILTVTWPAALLSLGIGLVVNARRD